MGCLGVFIFFYTFFKHYPSGIFLYLDPGTDLYIILLCSALLFGRWIGGVLNINVQLMIRNILSIFFKPKYI